MTKDFNVSVSMDQAAAVKTGVILKQGDFGFDLKITVLDFVVTGTIPQIVFRKAMGAVESTDVTASGNVYTYTFKGTELDVPGKVFCDLKLKNSTTQRISTASFMFEVVADTLDGLAEESSSYSDTIEQLLENTLQKSETEGLVKNDGTIDSNQYALNSAVVSNTGDIAVLKKESHNSGNSLSPTFTNGKFYTSNGNKGDYSPYQASDAISTAIDGIACDIEFDVKINTATYCLFYNSDGTIIGRLVADTGEKVVHGSTADYEGCAYFVVSNKTEYSPVFIAYPKLEGMASRIIAANQNTLYPFSISGGMTDIKDDLSFVDGYITTTGAYHENVTGVTGKTSPFIDINNYIGKTLYIKVGLALYNNPNVAVYDDRHLYLGKITLENKISEIMDLYDISRDKILNTYPKARYIRLCSWNTNNYHIWEANASSGAEGYTKLLDYSQNIDNKLETGKRWNWESIMSDITLSAGYIDAYTGNFISYSGEYCKTTDYIDFTSYEEKVFSISAAAKYSNATLAIYDENQKIIRVLANTTIDKYILDYEYLKANYKGLRYFRVGSFTTDPVILAGIPDEYEAKLWKRTTINDIVGVNNGYINYSDGRVIAYNNAKVTDLIPINKFPAIYYRGKASENSAAMWCLYDEDGEVVAKQQASFSNVWLQNYKIDCAALAIANPTAEYIRVCSIYANMYLSAFHYVYGEDVINTIINQNVLYGKKYVSCGDSFTEGPFSAPWDDASLYYSYDFQCWKTYPYWIASRNNMDLLNEAKSGSQMYNNGNPDSNAFSIQRYKDIPEDADYITLMFGLNETGAPIGTLEDTENTTVMGAWNVVLEYLIEHHPYAKIGIIIADSWLSEAQRTAQIEIAHYWGIPYLDLRGGEQVPLGINGKIGYTIAEAAKTMRDDTMTINPSSDHHPNPHAHKYRSTFIEAWLRTL